MKVINKNFLKKIPQAEKNLKNEVTIHKKLEHKRLVKYIDFFEDPDNYYMLLELCTNEVSSRRDDPL